MTAAGESPKMQVSDNFVPRAELLDTGGVGASKTIIEIFENRRNRDFKNVIVSGNTEHMTGRLRLENSSPVETSNRIKCLAINCRDQVASI